MGEGEEEKKWKEEGKRERERRDEHQAAGAGALNRVAPRFLGLIRLWDVTRAWYATLLSAVARDSPVVQGSVDASDMEMQG